MASLPNSFLNRMLFGLTVKQVCDVITVIVEETPHVCVCVCVIATYNLGLGESCNEHDELRYCAHGLQCIPCDRGREYRCARCEFF